MATVHLRIGDLVWGKLGRYPPWPGKIVSPPKDLKKPRGKKCHFVKFFGTEDHAWIKVEQLKPYHAHKEEMIKINKGKRFQQAVDSVEDFLKKSKGKEQNSDSKGDSKGKKAPNKPLKILEEDDEDLSALKDPSEKDLTDSDPEPSTIERLGSGPGSGFKWESSPVKDDPHFHHFLLSQSEKPASSMEPISKRLKIIEEDTGSTSIQAADSTAINGSITPTDKRIGFLGLGLMGSGIVSNLLKMGHVVTVWNRTAEKEAGEIPVSQLRMLSLGLAHLLQGVEENAKRLEQQGEQVAAELDRATKSLESLRKQSLQRGRTHRQVRKDLRGGKSAHGDRLWRAVRDLQKGLDDLETAQGATQHRMNRILQRVKSLTEPSSGGQAQLDVSAMKVIIDKQARQLASLSSEVSARGSLIDRRLQYIDHLEKQVSERLPVARRADSDFV